VHDPPRPLTEEDIWFQIGHVHEQQKDVCSLLFNYRSQLTIYSSTTPKPHIVESSIVIQSTQKFFNSLAGSTISRARALPAKSRQSSIWKSLSLLVSHQSLCGCATLSRLTTSTRSKRCAKLVSAWSLLHVTAEVSESIRSVPTGCLPRWSQPNVLVLDRSALLPDQPIP
jgi:hypothetical protein